MVKSMNEYVRVVNYLSVAVQDALLVGQCLRHCPPLRASSTAPSAASVIFVYRNKVATDALIILSVSEEKVFLIINKQKMAWSATEITLHRFYIIKLDESPHYISGCCKCLLSQFVHTEHFKFPRINAYLCRYFFIFNFVAVASQNSLKPCFRLHSSQLLTISVIKQGLIRQTKH